MAPRAAAANVEQLLQLLDEAPRRIAAATRGIPEERLYLKAEAEPWSVSDILAHTEHETAHCAQIEALLAEGDGGHGRARTTGGTTTNAPAADSGRPAYVMW